MSTRTRTIHFPDGTTRTETTKAAKVMTHAVVCLENLEHRAAEMADTQARLKNYRTAEELETMRQEHAERLAHLTERPWGYMSQHTSRELAEKAMQNYANTSTNIYWHRMTIVEVTEVPV